ncbi:hypothetical protein ElyMa_003256300 [Elysia marginata]|uniref:Uncharacterized protein n=1 Tax=Elysia marginata TaxID=1093978 RepID=A0AAV4J5N5_9GAST|nr:hypothetical protein ElyMa_003256300 [Elysia marginata]
MDTRLTLAWAQLESSRESSHESNGSSVGKADSNLTGLTSNFDKVRSPMSFACHRQDGSCVMADSMTRSLHLISPHGGWVSQVWAHPGGADDKDELISVSILDNTVLCCTLYGTAFVLDGLQS